MLREYLYCRESFSPLLIGTACRRLAAVDLRRVGQGSNVAWPPLAARIGINGSSLVRLNEIQAGIEAFEMAAQVSMRERINSRIACLNRRKEGRV